MNIASIALLVRDASAGNHFALAALMGLAIGTNAFMARRAAKALKDNFSIEIKK